MTDPHLPRTRRWLLSCIRDVEQLMTDIDSYNENATPDPPLDAEPERVMICLAKRAVFCLDRNDLPGFRSALGRFRAYCRELQAEH